MKLFNVLSADEIDVINGAVLETNWVDGRETAKGNAKNKKQNFQITDNDPVFRSKILPIISKVQVNPVVQNYSHASRVISPRLASYYEGGHYDWHVDTAIMQQYRTDLSFTIFLTEKESYEGGEMEITFTGGTTMKVKGEKGQMLLYPSGFLHKVNPVSKGERRVIVGWLKSNVKLHEHRERLYDLLETIAKLRKQHGSEAVSNLNKLYYQLLRDYCD